MKKIKGFELFLVFLWTSAVLRTEAGPVMSFLDKLSLKVIGKALSGRSAVIRFTVFLLIALSAAFLIWTLLQRMKTVSLCRICLILSLVLLFVLCALQTLRRDDYWEIRDAEKYGFWEYIRYEYVTFNGRFFSLFLKALYLFIPPTFCINTLLILTIILLCAGSAVLLCAVSAKLSRLEAAVLGISAALGMLFISPKIWETWFWGSGTLVYGTGIALAVMSSALMLEIEVSDEKKKGKVIAAFLCLTCTCGCSELAVASVCAFSLMLLLFPKLLYKRRWNIRNAFLTLWIWMLTVFVLFTSGNFSWADSLSGSESAIGSGAFGSLPEKVIESAAVLCRYTYSRIEYLLIFAGLFFLIGLCFRSARIPLKALSAAAAGLILTAIAVCTINTVIDFTPARVVSIPLSWVCLAVILIMYSLGSYAGETFLKNTALRVTGRLIPLILLTVTAHFFLGNIGPVWNIRTAWIERDRTLSAMNGSDIPVATCAIPVLGSSQADPGTDPENDINIVTAYYYGFPSVTADHLCPPFKE